LRLIFYSKGYLHYIMTKPMIAGIQQVGVGIPNVYDAWKFYRQAFGMNIPIFDEAATAALMLPYTGGEPRDRHAVLAINANGGGGFEIWQYTNRVPQAPNFKIQLGDLGIYSAKIKSKNVSQSHAEHTTKDMRISPLAKMPNGEWTYWLTDPYDNIFQVVSARNWFRDAEGTMGGSYGAVIGVTDIERSMKFYRDILGYDSIVYDKTGNFEDFAHLPSGTKKFRRVLLKHSKPRVGAFSQLLGDSVIELIQALERTPTKIYKNRLWGDLGFIHLCFDISGMEAMRELCNAKGYPFTVDSGNKFDMGEAAGHFTYIEDPDGTLIEFVETHRIPIMKKIGWYLDLRKRNPNKPLPVWMIRALGMNKVKD
jgi:catechol 2,3-dioxygenase-like lactoylglutathione lyase family enzyme